MSMDGLFSQLNDSILRDPLNKQYDFGVEGEPHSAMDNVDPRMKNVANGLLGGLGAMGVGGPQGPQPLRTSQEKVAKRKADHRDVLAKQAASLGLHDLAKGIVTGDIDNKDALAAIQAHKDAEAEKDATTLENERKKAAEALLADAKVKEAEDLYRRETEAEAQKHKNDIELEKLKHKQQLAEDAAERDAELAAEEAKTAEEAAAVGEGVYSRASRQFDIGSGSPFDKDYPVTPMPAGTGEGKAYHNKEINDAAKESEAAALNAQELASLATAFGNVDDSKYSKGWAGQAETMFAKITGDMDGNQLLKLNARALLVRQAIGSLPAGPASDKDIALVMNTVLDANTSAKDMASYFRGMAKAALIAKARAAHAAEVTRIQGNRGGAQARWEAYSKKRFPGVFGTKEEREAATIGKAFAVKEGIALSPRDEIDIKGVGVDDSTGEKFLEYNRADFLLGEEG